MRLPSKERRQAIVTAVKGAFAAKGFDGTTTRELARAAGRVRGAPLQALPEQGVALRRHAGRVRGGAHRRGVGPRPHAAALDVDAGGAGAPPDGALRPVRRPPEDHDAPPGPPQPPGGRGLRPARREAVRRQLGPEGGGVHQGGRQGRRPEGHARPRRPPGVVRPPSGVRADGPPPPQGAGDRLRNLPVDAGRPSSVVPSPGDGLGGGSDPTPLSPRGVCRISLRDAAENHRNRDELVCRRPFCPGPGRWPGWASSRSRWPRASGRSSSRPSSARRRR